MRTPWDKTFRFTLSDELHAKLLLLGGGHWLRHEIDKARLKSGVAWPSLEARNRSICLEVRPAKLVAADYNISRHTVYNIRDQGRIKGWEVIEFEHHRPFKSRRKSS